MKGNFSLALGQAANDQLLENVDASENGRSGANNQLQVTGCDLRAVLAGYISSEIHLAGVHSESGIVEVGTINLKRLAGAPEGATISATSFQVPDKARKEFEKARKEEEKDRADHALEHLQRAVEIYPNYAAAWVEMGTLQASNSRTAEAMTSFKHAASADPKYAPPYLHMALLAIRQNQWEDALQLSDRAIRLDPVDFADAYFLNAIANFNLHRVTEARTAAIKAASMDTEHRQPKIQYLLAAIYEASGERQLAAQHLREYLKLAPDAPDASAAKQSLERLNKETTASADSQ